MAAVSIIIPCFNESRYIRTIVERVVAAPVADTEVILVDDGSTDGTTSIIQAELAAKVAHVVYHSRNAGKGAAIRSALPHVTGEVVIIQDADLEYSPSEYPRLLEPIISGRADAVYGSRFIGKAAQRHLNAWTAFGNRCITWLSNVSTGLPVTDVECGYKVFRKSVLDRLQIQEDGFGVEIELTVKIARLRVRVEEVGVSYQGRSYKEGKKIMWWDGLHALWCIIKYCGQRGGIVK
jgi:glycosyltransferase involved in cell wall biosynthesis